MRLALTRAYFEALAGDQRLEEARQRTGRPLIFFSTTGDR